MNWKAPWRTRPEVGKWTPPQGGFSASSRVTGSYRMAGSCPSSGFCRQQENLSYNTKIRITMVNSTVKERASEISFSETSKHCQSFMLCLTQLKPLLFRSNLQVPVRENTLLNHYHLQRWRLTQAATIRTEVTGSDRVKSQEFSGCKLQR